MKVLALAALLLWATTAWAIPLQCEPKSLTRPLAVGSPEVSGTTPAGEWHGWWCPGSPGTWRTVTFACLTKYCTPKAALAALYAAWKASEPIVAINQSLLAGEIVPAVGTQDAYDFALLHWQACIALTNPPTISVTPPADYCGQPPTPPAAAPWKVLTGNLYTVVGGAVGGYIPGRTAPPGSACACDTLSIKRGTLTYCPLASGPSTEVTACQAP